MESKKIILIHIFTWIIILDHHASQLDYDYNNITYVMHELKFREIIDIVLRKVN